MKTAQNAMMIWKNTSNQLPLTLQKSYQKIHFWYDFWLVAIIAICIKHALKCYGVTLAKIVQTKAKVHLPT